MGKMIECGGSRENRECTSSVKVDCRSLIRLPQDDSMSGHPRLLGILPDMIFRSLLTTTVTLSS